MNDFRKMCYMGDDSIPGATYPGECLTSGPARGMGCNGWGHRLFLAGLLNSSEKGTQYFSHPMFMYCIPLVASLLGLVSAIAQLLPTLCFKLRAELFNHSNVFHKIVDPCLSIVSSLFVRYFICEIAYRVCPFSYLFFGF